MSELSNIPAHAVLPLSGYNADNLRRGADRFDQQILECDLGSARDQQDVLSLLGKAFGLAQVFWKSLDALYEGITALKVTGDKPGLVVLVKNIPWGSKFPSTQREDILNVFRRAADFFYEHDTAFRVFYSVNKAG